MSLQFSILSQNIERKKEWASQLQKLLDGILECQITLESDPESLGQIVLVDAEMPHISECIEQIQRKNRAVFLVLNESTSEVPAELSEGIVDDVLLAPFRALDIVSKVRYYEQILLWSEVSRLNSSFSDLLQQVREDYSLVERLQKARLPVRFPKVKGYQVSSRYLAGMRSGGDFFDLAESKDKTHYAIVLSSSSSYGLANALLAMIMKVMLKITQNHLSETGALQGVIAKICEELIATLNEKDQFSLFYGVISRSENTLQYINLGNSRAFVADVQGKFRALPAQGPAISQKQKQFKFQEEKIQLNPESRFVLLSDGFLKVVQGEDAACHLLDRFRDQNAADALNEMTFQVKSKLTEDEPMPFQDCTALVIDSDSRVLRLTKPKQGEN
jgi:hypothetical protein